MSEQALRPFESMSDFDDFWQHEVENRACPICSGEAGKCVYGIEEQREALPATLPIRSVEDRRASEPKPLNPKDSVGVRKVPASCIPRTVLAELGLAMMEGARKYGRHNYRAAGIIASVNYDAAMRHLDDWWEGMDNDPESGANLSHITKAIAALAVLRDGMIQGNWIDDRPPASPAGWLQELNAKASTIIDKFKDALPAFTNKPRES